MSRGALTRLAVMMKPVLRILGVVILSACAHGLGTTTNALTMRIPDTLFRIGPADPTWFGRAVITGNTLELEFPAIAANNVGCADVDSTEGAPRRRYYWLATARYPGSRYPDNHYEQVALDFFLAPSAVPTQSRLDSAIRAAGIVVREAAGEPPMIGRMITPDRVNGMLIEAAVYGERAWRLKVSLESASGIAVLLSTRADSLSLGWCQRSQWLTTITVPLERRP